MPYSSEPRQVDVHDEIAVEVTRAGGTVDDNLAGLHEIRARAMEARSTEATESRESLEAEGWRILPKGRDRPAA